MAPLASCLPAVLLLLSSGGGRADRPTRLETQQSRRDEVVSVAVWEDGHMQGDSPSNASAPAGEPGRTASIKVVSQDLMAWQVWRRCGRRGKTVATGRFANIMSAVKSRAPAVVGFQAHPGVRWRQNRRSSRAARAGKTKGRRLVKTSDDPSDDDISDFKNSDYQAASEEIERQTGLKHLGYCIYYDESQVTPVSEAMLRKILDKSEGSYRKVPRFAMGAIFEHKASGVKFAFFDSQWGREQHALAAERVRSFVAEEQFKGLPVVLTGQFNTWNSNDRQEVNDGLIQALGLKDALEGKGGTYVTGEKMDYILYSPTTISAEAAEVDRTESKDDKEGGCGPDVRSDHALNSAEFAILR